MKLLVIRHGESEADLLKVHESRADFSLTKRGKSQATYMSEWVFQRYEINKIYCSPLKRAFQTASILSQTVSIEICKDDNLMEFNNGLIAGMSRDEAEKKYPYVADLPIHKALYEQESKLHFRYRADAVLSKIISENTDEATVAIITHGGMITQLFRSFLRLPVDSNVFLNTGDTGIHEWNITKDYRSICFSNSCIHTAILV